MTAIDESALTEVLELLGEERLRSLVASFRADLLERFSNVDCRRKLEGEAHKTASVAGLLGLEELHEAAASLEDACFGDVEVAATFLKCVQARDEAIVLLDERRWSAR